MEHTTNRRATIIVKVSPDVTAWNEACLGDPSSTLDSKCIVNALIRPASTRAGRHDAVRVGVGSAKIRRP